MYETLKDSDVRVELDDRNEKVGYKIRDWDTKKVPFMLVVGEKEKVGGTVKREEFQTRILDIIKTRALTV